MPVYCQMLRGAIVAKMPNNNKLNFQLRISRTKTPSSIVTSIGNSEYISESLMYGNEQLTLEPVQGITKLFNLGTPLLTFHIKGNNVRAKRANGSEPLLLWQDAGTFKNQL